MERTAACACGRLQVRVEGEPSEVLACHCDFCQRRTGGVYPIGAWFDRDQVIEVIGDRSVYNGLEVEGVGGAFGQGVAYHFCPTCGSTVYWTFETIPDAIPEDFAATMARTFAVAVGSFADPDFPAPTSHLDQDQRPRWLTPAPEEA